ncbi:hypothetical protein KI387_013194, partial [Taxus chinensis]
VVYGTVGTLGREGCEKLNRSKVGKIIQVFCFVRVGTVKTKVCVGRESADFLKDSPFWAVQRYSSRTAGKKVCVGRELTGLPKDSPFRAVRRYSSGTARTKVREGRVR